MPYTAPELKKIIDNFEAWWNGPEAKQKLADLGESMHELDSLDDQIATSLRIVEDHLRERKIERVHAVRLDSETELAWSGVRPRGARERRWRLVLRDLVDGDVTPVLSLARDERAEVALGLPKLLAEINREEELARGRRR